MSQTLTKPDVTSSLSTWLYYLEQIHPKTIELGLHRVKKVAEELELLNVAPYVFTVAGTNGKGTTCRAIEMILLEQGYRVGVYSSPHLISYTERVRINNQQLPEQDHVDAFYHIESQRGETSLTYFEYSTLAALQLFKQAQLDVVILEVGLGGRLDATNIIDADVAVITSIAIDHTDYLGTTRESIGQEKAGIFKEKSIVVVGEKDCPDSIYQAAKATHVKEFHICSPNSNDDWFYRKDNSTQSWSFESDITYCSDLPIPRIPLANAATALAAVTYSSLEVRAESIEYGLLKSSLPGRFQQIQSKPAVFLDVAHNPHSAQYLNSRLCCLRHTYKSFYLSRVRIVIGMLKDKDIKSTVEQLQANNWYCATLDNERGATAQEIAQYLPNHKRKIQLFDSVVAAWQKALSDASEKDIIVVCGSFYTVAQILELQINDK